ncbi:MAG: hypothetical protein ACKO2D_00460 [Chloroflexota bacterium]|jgi:hypothetical protein|nr:hypothetical protein [Chloroflexota bacterium]NCA12862.1 hypothetical protein [Pseudomonadota bacterium]
MDAGQPISRPYAEDARRVLAAAALRAAEARDVDEGDPGVPPPCVSAMNILDVFEFGPPSPASPIPPVPAGTRLTPLVQQIVREASRVAADRDAGEITADDLGNAIANVMHSYGINPHRLSEARMQAHYP